MVFDDFIAYAEEQAAKSYKIVGTCENSVYIE
jgi:hypothetical protein